MTVGDLRAELVGWPDDAILTVAVPDPDGPTGAHVLPVVTSATGLGSRRGPTRCSRRRSH